MSQILLSVTGEFEFGFFLNPSPRLVTGAPSGLHGFSGEMLTIGLCWAGSEDAGGLRMLVPSRSVWTFLPALNGLTLGIYFQ